MTQHPLAVHDLARRQAARVGAIESGGMGFEAELLRLPAQ